MSVLPPNYRGGTTLNPQITSYEDLSVRIQRQLGAPLVNLEISDEQIYDSITDSIEYFTKWAGYTEEYLVFDSRLYIPGVGIKVDDLINKTDQLTHKRKSLANSTKTVSGCECPTPSLSAEWDAANPTLSGCAAKDDYEYDYDMASFRKVIDCFEFSKGEDTGINTLFTLEQAMANQIYSSYMVSNAFGFDLVTWETLKQFIDTRNKVLALTPHFRFDSRTQILRIIPEPQETHTYYGIVGCYIERPIKDLVKERWVQKYALALTKISIGSVRGKFPGTNMFGGGTINYADFYQQGLKEKELLEQELMNNYIDNAPPTFFLG
jgi:hypothetical protein